MPGYVWAALALFLGFLAGGLAFAGSRALAAWRRGKPGLAGMKDGVGDLSRRAAQLGRRAEEAGRAGSELALAVWELQRSLARLRLALAAVEEARLLAGRFRWLYPRL